MGDFSQGNRSYPTNEDAAVEDGHGDGDFQRYSFADANIEVWGLTQTDVTAEEMWDLLREVHGGAAGRGPKTRWGQFMTGLETLLLCPSEACHYFKLASKQSD